MRGLIKYAALLGASIVVAVAFLALCEVVLRLFGVAEGAPAYDPLAGFSTHIPIFEPFEREGGVSAYRISDARLSQPLAASHPEWEFSAERSLDSFRAFVIGGSSAAGFPYPPKYAFAASLGRHLQAALPKMEIEVVNAALPGYGSRRVLVIAREVAAYDPDLVILYSGHNEWAERRFHRRIAEMNPTLFAVREFLVTTRLSKLLAQLTQKPASEAESHDLAVAVALEQREMFKVLGKRSSGEAYPTAEEIAVRDASYRANVEEVVRTAKSAGANVVLMTLAQNFADWEPGASAHAVELTNIDEERWYALMQAGHEAAARGDCRAALDSFTKALEIDSVYALLHYRVAECRRALGELGLAQEHYQLASDLDRVPHGAPTRYNDFLRELAEREQVLLVDTDAVLRRASRDGLIGNEFFNEFVHPNLRSNQLIGRTLGDALRAAGIPRPAGDWLVNDYSEPSLEELYAADPDLKFREHFSWRAVCLLSRRERCAEEQLRILKELGFMTKKRRLPER